MGEKTAEELLGFEYDWIASDADAHVALFTTAGGGFTPKALLQDVDDHEGAIESILSRPTTTTARIAPELAPHLENTWRAAAEHGLFAFDADANGGPYRLVAAPAQPITVADLPSRAARTAETAALTRLRFATSITISKEMIEPS